MRLVDSYPVFITEKLAECRAFYTRLGFAVVFEASWFLYLSSGSERPFSLAFMKPEHPSSPPSPGKFAGDGTFLTWQVEDVRSEYESVRKLGVPIEYQLRDEPWGQRRFALIDPAGLWLDIVEQIEPVPGFWDPYLIQS